MKNKLKYLAEYCHSFFILWIFSFSLLAVKCFLEENIAGVVLCLLILAGTGMAVKWDYQRWSNLPESDYEF